MRPELNLLDGAFTVRVIAQAQRILAEIGFEIQHEMLREMLLGAGLRLDLASGRVLFPPEIVERAVETAPARFDLFDREGHRFTTLGDGAVHFVPGSSALQVLDHRTGETRSAASADFVDYVRLADGLEHISHMATAFSTGDVEPGISDAWRLYLCLTNSLKPVVSGAFTAEGVPRMAEIMALFRHDRADLRRRPFSVFTITPSGSFRYGPDSCQNLMDCVAWGIPIEIVPVTLMGLIAPVTLLEALAFHTADVLAGVTMAQLLRPGHPLLFGGAPATFHMREATSPMMAVEALRLDVAFAAVGKHLGLPTQAYMALSDSKFVDAQAGAESFGSALLAALAGIDAVSGPGLLDFVKVFSLAKLAFDNEVCGQALHFVRDVDAADDTSALELARELLARKHLLASDHTLRHWPEHLYLPGQIYDRANRQNWAKRGARDLQQRAAAEIEERLSRYQPVETDPRLDAEMRRLIRSGMSGGGELPAVSPSQGGKRLKSRTKTTRRPRPASTHRRSS